MNRSEVATVIGIIRARYPHSTWGPDDALTVEAWHMSLGDLPVELVRNALVALFHESEFAPDPVEIRKWVLAETGIAPDPAEAWRIARGAMRAYYPGFPFEYQMPDAVRQAINAIGGLHNLNTSENPNRDRDAFFKAYAVYRKRALSDTRLGLPEGVTTLAALHAGNAP